MGREETGKGKGEGAGKSGRGTVEREREENMLQKGEENIAPQQRSCIHGFPLCSFLFVELFSFSFCLLFLSFLANVQGRLGGGVRVAEHLGAQLLSFGAGVRSGERLLSPFFPGAKYV